MTERIIIAGAGGQGIMLLGKILAEAAMREGKFVTCLPAYGAEVRGGTAHCMVVISDQKIGSPYIDKADSLIIMNNPSLERFGKRLREKGSLFVNSSLAYSPPRRDAQVYSAPFTETAVKLGNIKVANTVVLGYYLSKHKIIKFSTVLGVIREIAPKDKKDLIKINQKALRAGSSEALQ